MEKKKTKKYTFKIDHEEPIRDLIPKEYVPERGIHKPIAPDEVIPKLERFKYLEHYKDAFHLCVKCGNCRTVFREANWARTCPSGELRKFETYYAGGKNLLLWGIVKGKLKLNKELAEIFYHCSLCGNCQEQCNIPEIRLWYIDWLEAFREKLVKQGLGPMPQQERFGKHVEVEHNPYMEKHQDRWNWLPFPQAKLPKKAEIAFFVGCTNAYREQSVARVFTEILKDLNLDFTIMKDEWCCGSPLMRTGQIEKAKACVSHNVEEIKKTGAKRVVTACAGCYRTFKEDYAQKFGMKYDFEVLHAPEFLLELIKEGTLKLKKLDKEVTYHDPCHIGRHMGVYEPPRDLIQSIKGIKLKEMPRNRHNAWCCGSGGGVRASFPELAYFAANERLKEAKDVNVKTLISACPFCEHHFRDAIKESKEELEVLDLVELVRMAME